MADTTNIAWCDSTLNPWIGCTKVGPGCDHCYASVSTPARSLGVVWGVGQPRRRTSEANWKKPLSWNARPFYECRDCGWRGETKSNCPSCAAEVTTARRRVFCASLADVFDNEVPEEWRVQLWGLIENTPNLDWLLLTKRIGNAAKMLPSCRWGNPYPANPYPNVWLGATIVNQEEADRDIPKLLATPAAKRFVSYEPALSAVDFSRWMNASPQVRKGGLNRASLHREKGEYRLQESLAVPGSEKGPLGDGFPPASFGAGMVPNHGPTNKRLGEPIHERSVGVVDREPDARGDIGVPSPVNASFAIEQAGGVSDLPFVGGNSHGDRVDALANATHFDAPGKQPASQCSPRDSGFSGQSFEGVSALVSSDQRGLLHDPHCTKLDWVIIGGESAQPGYPARPFDIAWARDTVRQCREAGVACFVKQAGSYPILNGERLSLSNRSGSDIGELPQDLRVQEFPCA